MSDDTDSYVAKVEAAFAPIYIFPIGARVRVDRPGVQWRGVVVGYYTTLAGHKGYVVESLFETGQVHVERERWVVAWAGEGA